MLKHTNLFQEFLNTYGRQLSIIIQDSLGTVFTNNEVVSVTKTFKTDLCKSTMQQLDFEIEGDIAISDVVKVKLGVFLQGMDIEEVDFGEFIVTDREYVVDTDSTKFTAYDNMYKAHVSFDANAFAFPCTIYELAFNICTLLEIPFEQKTFNNSTKIIKSNVFKNSILTYRDVFDMLAQATGLNVFISDNKLVFKKYQKVDVVVDEVTLKTLALKEKYGPINSLVFSRSADSDSIYRDDADNIEINGLNDIKFSDNLILDAANRNDYIDDAFEMLKGLNYKIFDLEGFGCCIFEPGDIFELKDLKGNVFETIAFNSTITINSGITEKMYVDAPSVSETDYSSATKDEKKDLNTYLKVNKELGEIKSYVEDVQQLVYKYESGSSNLFDNCRNSLSKTSEEKETLISNDMPLIIDMTYLKGNDICISVSVKVVNGVTGELNNRIGAEFDVGYVDGTKKTYSVYWYLGQFDLQYLLQTSTADIDKRIWMHYKLEDKEVTSVSNLRMSIELNAEKATISNPKVEFGTEPSGMEFDIRHIQDSLVTIEKKYTTIEQDVESIRIATVESQQKITEINTNLNTITSNIDNLEIDTSNLHTALADVNSTVSSINGTIESMKTTISETITKQSEIKSTVDDLTLKTSKQEEKITNIETKVATNEGSIGTINSSIKEITSNYTEIKSTVDSLSLKAVSQEEKISSIDGSITDIEGNVSNIEGNISTISSRLDSAEINIEPSNILLAVNSQISSGGSLKTTKFSLDKSGVHIAGGGLDIKNTSGDKVLYADTDGNLVINNLTAKNGTFSGKVQGSTIMGSSIYFTEDGQSSPYISLDGYGLVIDSSKVTNQYVTWDKGKLELETTWGYFVNCSSPIRYTTADGTKRYALFGENIAYMRFVNPIYVVNQNSYLEVTTLGGAWGLTAWLSDQTLKTNISNSVTNGIDVIKKIAHRSFNWIDTGRKNDCGYIAQELAQLNSDFVLPVEQPNGNTMYQVNETTLIPVITKALQELINKVEILEGRLN